MVSKKEFWEWFKKDVQTRWARCTFEWTEIGDWYWRLRGFDLETLTRAVRQHKVCECYPVPNLKKVYDYARTMKADTHPRRKSNDCGIPETHTFIMCTEKDDRGRGTIGWFVDILLWPLNKTYSEDIYRRVAAEQAARHASTYGGVWEIVTRTNRTEMLKRRMKLRGIQPLNLPAKPSFTTLKGSKCPRVKW